jgi:uncharacterized protein YoxC
VSCLLGATIVFATEYYRRLRKAQREYEKARDSVEDIVLSFNRQFRRQDERLETVAYKVEAFAAKSDNALNKAEDVSKKVNALEAKIGIDSERREETLARLDGVDKSVRDIITSQEAISVKITNLEQQAKQLPAVPESGLEAVIPIRREKALAQLTATEVSVLEMLAAEGSKTAPEIKERVRLSREHTARLMKKLYEEGYLERETGKIPFKYSVKKEMEKLLKRTESQAA